MADFHGIRIGVGVRTSALVTVLSMLAMPAIAAPASAYGVQVTRQQTRVEQAAARRAAREARRAQRRNARRTARPAQAARPATAVGAGRSANANDGEIVVTGLRKSVAQSIDRKRNARQIVDVVTAEDAGKLPDNNVVEAMARVTGITVTRSGGRADGFNIRGLAGVQTTVNGTESATAPLPGGEGRTLALQSIPADLIKSIEVYKSRTADQIEGGIGGSVNIELRRPLDLQKGWTVAGGVKGVYSEQGDLFSPAVNGLIAKRFDTGIGEMGFLLNGGYTKQRYAEAYSTSESPFLLGYDNGGTDIARIRQSLPADIRGTVVAPYRASYATNDGEREQKSLSAVWQWRASPQLDIVLEGSYFGEEFSDAFSSLYVRTREDYYVLKNLRTGPGGVLLGYDITNPALANGSRPNNGNIAAGFEGGENRGKSENFRTNLETHYAIDGLRIDASAQYQWSNNKYHGIGHGGSFSGLTNVRVDFDSPKVLGNGPYFEFNVSPTDPNLARVQFLRDNLGLGENKQYSSQVDFWKEIDRDGLLRASRFGVRFARNDGNFQDGYRFVGFFPPDLSIPFRDIPGVSSVSVTPELPGGSPLSWVQLNNGELYDNWDKVRQFIRTRPFEFLDGPGRDSGVNTFFNTDEPNSANPTYTSKSRENIFAAYGTLDYAFKVGFPIDGNVGLRYVNTWATIDGSGILFGPRILDPVTGRPTGAFGPDRTQITSVEGNYVDLLPSAFATVHFTNKLQLRGSYSQNVQRPSLFDLRNFRVIDYRNPRSRIDAGNPDLKPTTTDDFNLSLEWYPAPGSTISVTGFRKKQQGFIYFSGDFESVPELGGEVRPVFKPRNAGPGITQGIEFQATGFFRFLPGFLRNLGATANGTWIPTADVDVPNVTLGDNGTVTRTFITKRSPFTSRLTYNLIGYYETPQFSARLAYNWRSEFQTGIDINMPQWVQASEPTQRLDAAINYTPVRFLTLSIEGQNLMRNIDRFNYFLYPDLPVGLRAMGRTITAGARFRF